MQRLTDMNPRCDKCGEPQNGRSATACPACGAPVDWREPRAADPINDDDEKVVEDAIAVEEPADR